ncbi:hypothetical protein TRVL_05693 [Trypanosoma vivax]|nr:hypothetical protein TRVL_05693 [Trypanosoma vivax]
MQEGAEAAEAEHEDTQRLGTDKKAGNTLAAHRRASAWACACPLLSLATQRLGTCGNSRHEKAQGHVTQSRRACQLRSRRVDGLVRATKKAERKVTQKTLFHNAGQAHTNREVNIGGDTGPPNSEITETARTGIRSIAQWQGDMPSRTRQQSATTVTVSPGRTEEKACTRTERPSSREGRKHWAKHTSNKRTEKHGTRARKKTGGKMGSVEAPTKTRNRGDHSERRRRHAANKRATTETEGTHRNTQLENGKVTREGRAHKRGAKPHAAQPQRKY